MNIFFLDKNPEICAQNYCNRHVNKIIIELGQLLCQSRRKLKDTTNISYKEIKQGKKIIEWLTNSPIHYQWTLALGFALCNEYSYRYKKEHKSRAVIQECFKSFFACNIPNFFPVLTSNLSYEDYAGVYNLCSSPALAMPDEYKIKDDAIQSYRRYYALDKFYNIDFRYKGRQIPPWVAEIQRENTKIIR